MSDHITLRKIIHILTGLLTAWLAWTLPYPQVILVAFLFMVIVLMMEYWRMNDQRWRSLFRMVFHPFLRAKEHEHLIGTGWLVIGIFLTVLIPSPTAVVAGLLCWGLADPFGEIVGRHVRGPRLYQRTAKHWSGSISVLAIAWLSTSLWLMSRGLPHPVIGGLIVAAGVAVAEATADLTDIDDNLSIPVIGALLTLGVTAVFAS